VQVDSVGERSDLAYSEALTDLGQVAQVADGLVLTKWKKAAEAGDATGKFAEARRRILRRAKGKALWVVQSEQSPGFAEMDF
jgi:hypothetical protein